MLNNQTNEKEIPKKKLVFLLAIIVSFPIIINSTFSTRLFDYNNLLIVNDDMWLKYFRNISLLSLFLVCMIIIFFTKRIIYNRISISLWLQMLIFNILASLSSILGKVLVFSPQIFVIPLTFSALFVLNSKSLKYVLKIGYYVGLIFIYGSLITLFIKPSIALENPYTQSLLIPIRLHGIATHANHLAPMVILFFALDIYLKSSKFSRFINWPLGCIVLFLTQSKTTWIAVIISFLCTKFYLSNTKQRIIISLLAILFIIFSYFYIMSELTVDPGKINDSQIEQTITLTGRNVVWEYTINIWKENPWFGYGLNLWKDEMRLNFYSLYRWAPGQAHSQFFQTLGTSGIIGIIGLGIYVSSLIRYSLRYSIKTNGIIMFLVLVILIRSITESAMSSNLFIEGFIFHFYTYALLMMQAKEETNAVTEDYCLSRSSTSSFRNVYQSSGGRT